MKKILFVLTGVLLFFAVPQAKAQRRLPGQKAVQVTGGLVDGFTFKTSGGEYRYFGSIGFTHTNRNHTHWLFGLGYQQKDYTYREQVIPKVQFTGEAGYFFPVLKDRGQNVCLSLGVSAMGGYETSNWNNKLMDDGATLANKDCFIWGGAVSAEFETYLSDRFVFLLYARERALFGTDFGNFHFQAGIGFRFIIN